MSEDDETITVTCSGSDLGVLIGRHGQTIDSVQHLLNAIGFRRWSTRRNVVVDASGYRARRESTLGSIAMRSADQAVATGEPVQLEPMTAAERKIIHLRLEHHDGVDTSSEGSEPNRFVVVTPRAR